jgi:hypothetical protein
MLSVWPSPRQTACTSWKALAARNVGGGEMFCPSSLGARWVLRLRAVYMCHVDLCSSSYLKYRYLVSSLVSCILIQITRVRLPRPVRILAKSVLSSPCLCFRMHQIGSHWLEFHQVWYWKLLWKSVEKIKFGYNRAKISGTLHEDLSTLYRCWVHWNTIKTRSSSEVVSGC